MNHFSSKSSFVFLLVSLLSGFLTLSCDEDDPAPPPAENEEEIITDVVLTFTTITGGFPTPFTAQDPDGAGPENLLIQDTIVLNTHTPYSLKIGLENSLEGEDIAEEVAEEGDEHMFFFEWTEGLFTDPSGNGNIDNRADRVQYSDVDVKGLPIGLETNWTTGPDTQIGMFRVVLKHQPTFKSTTSTITTGSTDLDISFPIKLQ